MEGLWIRGRWWGCLGDDVGNMTAALRCIKAAFIYTFTFSFCMSNTLGNKDYMGSRVQG